MNKTQSLLAKFNQIIQNNKLAHLYLVVGSTLSRQKLFVLELAYRIFKPHDPHLLKKDTLLNSQYPNFYYLTKQNHLFTKEQILQFQKNFLQTSLFGTQRIYVIEEIEKITTQTSNSLLHFFENPSNNNTIGFLLTNNLEQVLPTIVSRCQIINISDTVDAKSQNLDSKTKSQIDAFDFSLSNLINKNSDQMDLFVASDYYQNFKQFFLDFLIQFPKTISLKLAVFASPLLAKLISCPHFLNDFLSVLLRFFSDILYEKTPNSKTPIYFSKTQILTNPEYQKYYQTLPLPTTFNILKIIHQIYKKQNILSNQENLFMALLIQLEAQRLSF
ncbi:MAG: DNA polymerase III subunit delta' [Candidatus Phytoplasma asteris]|uniref:DNA polymerase III, delta prime subunit n=2 Tax=16SrI (Aster yellows group) TaxID=3042590 RepID=Q6YQZ2_ONYPE|nr:DNA polymerase III subunit delta' ['Chrysanthemum coronarium' phytoplasma]TKA87560.1 MAG: DNA polymerase III subunit delta' [Periwinkle leaf yellowing phytoplasma]WEX19919.1 MAG: DNA polymerase III subunit delta' [Candidatus Phytoplasma asteris]BAD04316.1 DNA polymerase III, delta prime subunit [Onion yellows phytoplasma OY-M]BBC15108.1 ATPase involved in DNA replication [Onion yellows phytoplasma]GAK73922.1 DNA polymerase III delta prime subunit ['Chrysanthemum coronarium' phytoplasma]